MTKIYIIEDLGVNVVELDLLREDDTFVYARYSWQSGRGYAFPKYFARSTKVQALEDSVKMLEKTIKEHRSELRKII